MNSEQARQPDYLGLAEFRLRAFRANQGPLSQPAPPRAADLSFTPRSSLSSPRSAERRQEAHKHRSRIYTETKTENKRRSSLKIFSAFITKIAIEITVLDVSTSLVMIRSSLYFRLLVLILPSITERFLKSDLKSSCCSAVCTSDPTCLLRGRPLSLMLFSALNFLLSDVI
jgi:hypothetical protein